jgi:DNA-binding LacI/PurR family transcriptional regulator
MAMDIREIAKRAKVSTATVSRTINGNTSVDPHLAKRVWKVVEKLGYYPNTHARALVSGKSRLLGLIVSEITNPFFPEIVHSFEEIAVAHNYEILFASTAHDPNRMQSSVRRLLERQAEGVAILTFGFEDRLIEDFRYRNVPLVFVDVGPDLPGVTNIRINYMHGIREAVQHLAALRHERIAFVTGPLQMKSATARKTAFEQSMREIGLAVAPELIVPGDHTMEGGIRALVEIARLPSRPSAVLCSNDMTAIGIMRQAYDYGISVPDELSVIGFDNIRLSEFMIPPLTTVQMSQTELAKRAFEALVRVLNDKTVREKPQEYVLNTSLVLRRSTALSSRNQLTKVRRARASTGQPRSI